MLKEYKNKQFKQSIKTNNFSNSSATILELFNIRTTAT